MAIASAVAFAVTPRSRRSMLPRNHSPPALHLVTIPSWSRSVCIRSHYFRTHLTRTIHPLSAISPHLASPRLCVFDWTRPQPLPCAPRPHAGSATLVREFTRRTRVARSPKSVSHKSRRQGILVSTTVGWPGLNSQRQSSAPERGANIVARRSSLIARSIPLDCHAWLLCLPQPHTTSHHNPTATSQNRRRRIRAHARSHARTHARTWPVSTRPTAPPVPACTAHTLRSAQSSRPHTQPASPPIKSNKARRQSDCVDPDRPHCPEPRYRSRDRSDSADPIAVSQAQRTKGCS